MVVSSIILLWKMPKEFPRWLISASVILELVSVATTFYVYNSVIAKLPATGFTPELQKQILPISLYLQIIHILPIFYGRLYVWMMVILDHHHQNFSTITVRDKADNFRSQTSI